MIFNDFEHNIFDRIGWYTRGVERVREDRERLLAAAREAEELAATLQSLADDLRRLAQ